MTDRLTPERRIARYAETNPDATVTEALGALGLDPREWADTVEAALDGNPVENRPPEAGSPRSNPPLTPTQATPARARRATPSTTPATATPST